MVKGDKYYRDKLLEDVDFVIEKMNNETIVSLENNPILLDSMMFRLIQISENARNLSESFKSQYEDIPWTAIYGLRNRIVHDYGKVDLKVVFNTLVLDIPEIKNLLEEL